MSRVLPRGLRDVLPVPAPERRPRRLFGAGLAAVDLCRACTAAGPRRWLVDARRKRIVDRVGASVMAGAAAVAAR